MNFIKPLSGTDNTTYEIQIDNIIDNTESNWILFKRLVENTNNFIILSLNLTSNSSVEETNKNIEITEISNYSEKTITIKTDLSSYDLTNLSIKTEISGVWKDELCLTFPWMQLLPSSTATIKITSSTVTDCEASNGGVIFIDGASQSVVTLTDSDFYENTACVPCPLLSRASPSRPSIRTLCLRQVERRRDLSQFGHERDGREILLL